MPATDEPDDPVGAITAEVWTERWRQVEAEGYATAGDDRYVEGELAQAAATYAMAATLPPDARELAVTWLREGAVPGFHSTVGQLWPRSWDPLHFKPSAPRRDLIKACALLVAEIERLDRAEARG